MECLNLAQILKVIHVRQIETFLCPLFVVSKFWTVFLCEACHHHNFPRNVCVRCINEQADNGNENRIWSTVKVNKSTELIWFYQIICKQNYSFKAMQQKLAQWYNEVMTIFTPFLILQKPKRYINPFPRTAILQQTTLKT